MNKINTDTPDSTAKVSNAVAVESNSLLYVRKFFDGAKIPKSLERPILHAVVRDNVVIKSEVEAGLFIFGFTASARSNMIANNLKSISF